MSTTVYERLRGAILDGTLSPGQVVSENQLASELGASRTPVREALHRLEVEMLVERIGRTVRVRTTSPEEILDIYEVRITLEGAAARGAARRSTELDRARLRAANASMRAAGNDPKERAATNREFHETLWHASHSPTLVDLLKRLNVHLIRYPTTTLEDDDRWRTVLIEHDAMIEAIENQDVVRAQSLAESHMTGAREVRLKMMTQRVAAEGVNETGGS
ncbi:GntR family transcriptional regulator [Nocardia zapadnayensis]|uniref:GntR family transcriptional regulator n=1 Tax=Nocardia rhamnosiphila TaxID=426716 RepID=UPI002247800B|nr:GntR family transcriptional regulator [Nocardia zapadnayensis]MCX0272991.1 GntR family transcriptional regulator [Nocardia zapadnayensis]